MRIAATLYSTAVIYTNDNTDKKQRQQKYFLRVYIVPFFVTVLACILNYVLTDRFNLDRTDKTVGYIISAIMGLIVWFKNKARWLSLFDGSHFYVNDEEATTQTKYISHANEPLQYEAEFKNSISDQLIILVCGIIALIFGIRIIKNSSVIFPFVIVSIGLFALVIGYKGLIDRKPKLKLSRKGLWTRKLGFQPWTAIKKTKIVKEKSSRSTQVYLEIYLIDSEFADLDYPDERFSFSGIEKSSQIESHIEQFNSAINE